jgi:riboflavin kinase/FMN adenylyltransferase
LSERFNINSKTSAALGYFDGVHLGHIKVIKKAAEKGIQTVVITFDRLSWKIENGKPCREITTSQQKEGIFKELGVDAVCYLEFEKIKDMEPSEFVKKICSALNIVFISTGFNYRFGKNAAGGTENLKEYAARCQAETVAVEPVCFGGKTLSSTRIRGLIEEGKVDGAALMLSRPFGFLREVVHGRELGRTLGIPTINQLIPNEQILPKFGVYASKVFIDGKVYCGVTNVGVKPTVSVNEAPLSETHILDFDGDLYGKVLRTDLIKFCRPEMKFDNISLLKEQMKKDSANARRILKYIR